jgi:hypothetical protein
MPLLGHSSIQELSNKSAKFDVEFILSSKSPTKHGIWDFHFV